MRRTGSAILKDGEHGEEHAAAGGFIMGHDDAQEG
jgi:hypothetical protein